MPRYVSVWAYSPYRDNWKTAAVGSRPQNIEWITSGLSVNRPEQSLRIGRTGSDSQKSMAKPFCVSTGKSPNRPCQCRTKGKAFSSYLHSTRLSCEAMICHVPPRFSHVSVQTWHTFAFGWDLSLPTACSLP